VGPQLPCKRAHISLLALEGNHAWSVGIVPESIADNAAKMQKFVSNDASSEVSAQHAMVDYATQWVCDRGHVWRKIIDYITECPKGHLMSASLHKSFQCRVCGHCESICDSGVHGVDASTSKQAASIQEVDAPGEVSSCTSMACEDCAYSVCLKCIDTLRKSHSAPPFSHSDFPSLGVSAAFLKSFKMIWKTVIGRQTTEQICQQVIKPLSSRSQGSICDDLQFNGSMQVGVANIFLSHTWSDPFEDTIDAILGVLEDGPVEMLEETFIWFDVFSTSQHTSIDHPSAWWMSVFRSSIEKMGRLAMVLQPWDDPATLKRAW
jgi:hypothetical protein